MIFSYSFRERLAKRHIKKYIEAINGCGVLVLQGGKVLCGTRIERGGEGQMCGPGGHVEQGETPEEAAYREAKEEFNIICEELEFLGMQDGGDHYGKSAVFLCRKYYGEPKTDEVEMTDPQWVEPQELVGENLFPPFEQSLELLKIKKFNPYHGADGRFTTGGGATSFTIRTKDPSKQHLVGRAVVREAADQIRNLDHEELLIIDADGHMTHYVVGDEDSVGTTYGEMRDHAPGAVVMHNHPNRGTFSYSDLNDLGFRPSEIRAVSEEGDYIMRAKEGTVMGADWVGLRDALESAEGNFKYIHTLRNEIFEQKYRQSYNKEVNYIADKWFEEKNNGASKERLDEIIDEWKKAEDAWLKKYPKEERQREAEDAYLKQWHDFYREHADYYGIEYTFEPKIKKYNHNHGADGRFTFSNGSDKYSKMLRKDPPPKKTIKKVYKVFEVRDGKLYPPVVPNPDGVDTPMGAWLDSYEAPKASKTKTGRDQVKSTRGLLAFRPGWHLGDVPLANQFNKENKEHPLMNEDGTPKTDKRGKQMYAKEIFPSNFVFAECEISADVDYQEEAMSHGYNKNGNFQYSLAGLPKLPKDGCYRYRTNPNPQTEEWWIAGSMKVNRLLTDAEAREVIKEVSARDGKHREIPLRREGGELTQEKLDAMVNPTVLGEVKKYNHNHGPDGKFTTGSGKKSFEQMKADAKAKAAKEVAQFLDDLKNGNRRKYGEVPIDLKRSTETRGHIDSIRGIEVDSHSSIPTDWQIIMHDIGCDEDFAADVEGAIMSFTMDGYKDIRRFQRGDDDASDFYEAKSNILEAYVQNAPQWDGGTLYRGISGDEARRHYGELKVGDIIDMGGTASWSSSRYEADVHANGKGSAMFVTDKPGTATSVKRFSFFPEEDEVVTSKENRYVVDSIDSDTGKVYVSVVDSVKKYNHNHGADGRFTSGPSRGTRGHVTAENVDKYVSQEDHRKYGVSKALIMKDTKCSEKEAEEYQQAIQMWTVTSDDIRRVQRGEHGTNGRMTIFTEKDAKEYGDKLEEFIDKAPQWDGGTLYRGIELRDYNGNWVDDYITVGDADDFRFIQEGDIIDMGGTSSWSSDKDTASEFTSRRMTGSAVLFVSDNVGKATSIMPHSTMPFQEEVIASKDNKYKIDKIEKVKNGWQEWSIMHVSSVGEVKKFNMFHGKDGKFTFSPFKVANGNAGKFEGGHNRPKVPDWAETPEPRRFGGAPRVASSGERKRGHIELDEKYNVKDENGNAMSTEEVIAKELGCSREEAHRYAFAVSSFTESTTTCADIRAVQRGDVDEGFRAQSLKPTAEALDEYLEKAPQWNGGAIYRGIGENGIKNYREVHVGDVIDMGGASSWSSEKEVASRYVGIDSGELFVVDNPTKGTSTRHLSAFPNEYEVTVSSKVTYRVVSEETDEDGMKIIHLAQCSLPVTHGVSKSFSEILIEKFNHNHGPDGRFTYSDGSYEAAQRRYKELRQVTRDKWRDYMDAYNRVGTSSEELTRLKRAYEDASEKEKKAKPECRESLEELTEKAAKSPLRNDDIDYEALDKKMMEMADEVGWNDIPEDDRHIMTHHTKSGSSIALNGSDMYGYFVSGNSRRINEALRNAPDDDPFKGLRAEDVETINALDRNMRKTTETIYLGRMAGDGILADFGFSEASSGKVHANEAFRQLKVKDVESAMVGKVIVNKGYTSTSYDMSENKWTGKPIRFEIKAPKGTPMLMSTVRGWSGAPEQAEMLLPRGTAMQITGVRLKDAKYGGVEQVIIECEVITD